MNSRDFADICRQVTDLSSQIALFLRKESHAFDISKIETKGMNDLVSYVDREAENTVVSRLQEILPEAGFITEENPDFKAKTERDFHWIIDPLDGTTNFLHGLPIFAVSIGLMYQDKMVVGVVHEANRDECFHAWLGGGAYCNEQKIRVSPIQNLHESLLATGFPYRDFEQMPAYLDIIRELMYKTHGLRRMGSAAVDLSYVAMGRFQGFFEYNLNPWDVAAGALIIQEAGGTVSTFAGDDNYIFGREILAACPIHKLF
ncbi:MAG: inositol monophosphatase [Microscillaceae bacterium]|nr:inositol monophosphatase [Microscillaceae bacterium]